MRRALSRASSGSPKTCARPSPRRKSPAALARLETSYAEPLTPVELVRIAKLPAARFARIIKRIMGITPIQLISKTRLAAASRLLREKGRSVAGIAHECGFYDHSAFTRAFRAVTSLSPRNSAPGSSHIIRRDGSGGSRDSFRRS